MPLSQALPAHKTSHEDGGADEINATGLTGAGGAGLANLEDYSTFGVKLATSRNAIYDNAEQGHIILEAGVVSLESIGDEVGLYPDNGQVVNIGSGDGLLLPELAADPTAVRDGHIFYDTVTDKIRLRANGAWGDVGDPAAHIADAADAHDASAVSFDDTGLTITAADVQAMGEQLDAAISAGGIPATIFDAAGDIIVASAADTAVRLPIGAAGLLLKSNGTTATWTYPTFIGFRAWKAAAQSIANNTNNVVTTYDNEEYDANAIGGANGRITVPTGMDGKWRLTAFGLWTGNATGLRYGVWYKNGTTEVGMRWRTTPVADHGYDPMLHSITVVLAAADYVEWTVFQNSGGALNYGDASPYCAWIEAEFLGA